MPSIGEALKGSELSEAEQGALSTLIATSLGASIGSANGVSGSVVAGSGAAAVDLNNRQLHAIEINRIKALAGKFAEEKGISLEAAEARLLAQAQQNVDKDFATDHAMVDLSAMSFLRSQAATFVDESGRTMLMFAPGGKDAYEDAGMYGHTWNQFTTEQQAMLGAASNKKQSQKDSEIWDATRSTALGGLGKGVVNYPSDALNGIIDFGKQLLHLDEVGKEVVPVPLDYDNPVEREVASGTQRLIDNAMMVLGAAWSSMGGKGHSSDLPSGETKVAGDGKAAASDTSLTGVKGPPSDLPSGATKVVGDGAPAANGASFQGEKPTAEAPKPTRLTTVTDEMKANPYHPDWQRYAGSEPRAVGADVVSGVPQVVDPKSLIGRQGRDEISGSQVKRMTKDMKANGFDVNHPIEVANVNGKLIILDGHHRAEAAAKAGIKDVPVNVHSVTKEQADQLMREAAEARVRY